MRPDRPDFIVFGSPQILEEDIQEVVDTLRTGWIGSGPKVIRFEEAFRRLLGVPYAVAVSSCTAALSLALELLGVQAGDEVVTTPLTFAATANVIVHRGARPVFADIDWTTGNIDPAEIERHLGPRTRVILPVHLAGRPCAMREIMALARARGLYVLEDAAHAIETQYAGQHARTLGDMGAFSFYPTKSLTTGEGGMLVTSRAEWAQKAGILRLHGVSADAWARYSEAGFKHYEVLYPGYKYNMTDFQAALAFHQLDRLGQNLQHREILWQIYATGLKGLPGIHLPSPVEDGTIHARHLFTLCVDPDEAGLSRDELMQQLKIMKVGTGVHYTALHLQHFYRDSYGYRRGDYPNAEWFSDRTLSLPLTAKMSAADAEYVLDAAHYTIEQGHHG
jgi:dTDP-4-amino-4,6-dideoxygalactose transaminase